MKQTSLVTRKWNVVNDNSKSNYAAANEITYDTEILKSNLCDYNDAYILVRGDITIAGLNIATEVAFKNCASFSKCITNIFVRKVLNRDEGNHIKTNTWTHSMSG